MLMVSAPYVAPQAAHIVIAQTAPAAQSSAGAPARTIGVCTLVENPAQETPSNPGGLSATNSIAPLAAIHNYFVNIGQKDVDMADAQVSTLARPHHGKIESFGQGASAAKYYIADKGYFGTDSATFRVRIGERNIRVEFSIHVLDQVSDEDYSELCPNDVWRIAATVSGAIGIPASAYLSANFEIQGLSADRTLPL